MENLAGVIKFTADNMAAEEEKPYIPVFCDVSLKTLAEFMLDRWKMKVPDVMISIVTGVYHNKNWPEDYAIAFQAGLTKVINTSHAWILTHGFHTGVVKLLGEAVRDELDRRTVRKTRTVRRYNKRVSQITLVGICTDSLVNELEAFQGGEGSSGRRRVELDLGVEKPARQKFNLDVYHTHYVIVNGSTSKSLVTFRTDLEKELQRFSSCRKNFGNGYTENSSDEDDTHSAVPLRPTPDPSASRSQMGVPLVALMLQGGPYEILQVWTYIKNRTPVVVVKGSGLAADLFAYVYEETNESGDLEKDLANITPEILKRLETMFPKMKQGSDEDRQECCQKLLDCMRLDSAQEDEHYITILDLTRASSDLADIDLYILKAIFGSQKTREVDWKEQIRRDLMLTLQWNRPDFAREEIMNRSIKVKVDKDIFRLALIMKNREDFVDLILHQGFKTHKFLSHRALIDLFCHAEDTEFFAVNVLGNLMGYVPGTVIGERFVLEDLNWIIVTFTRVERFINAYELSTNSCGIYSTEPSVAERKSLNALIVWSTLMGRHELTKVFWKYVEDPITTAIFVSAMWNGLSRFCREPELEKDIRIWGREFGVMGMDVLNMAYKESIDRAFGLLDREFPDFGRRTPVQLAYDARNRWFLAHPCCQKWINRLYMGHIQIASAHPGSMRIPDFIKILLSAFLIFPMYFWIHFPSLDSHHGRVIRRRGTVTTPGHSVLTVMKEVDSKDIPLRTTPSRVSRQDTMGSEASLMGSSQNKSFIDDPGKTWLMQLQEDQQKSMKNESRRRLVRRIFFGAMTGGQTQFSLVDRVYLLWTAPVTKFWTFQFFYWMYLLLFSYVTLLPVCSKDFKALIPLRLRGINSMNETNPQNDESGSISSVDVILWIWTALIASEIFFRNYQLIRARQFSNFMTNIIEMGLMLGFLIAYFMVRVLSYQPNLVNAYNARVLMSVGLIYFSYRLIGIFFPISDTLGPMLVRIKYMIGVDFLNYLKMILPFLLAGGITVQAILYPDRQLSWEVLRTAFHRSFFSLFLSQPIYELAYLPECEANRWDPNEPKHYCRAGDYVNENCATIGFWSYIMVIQFMVILKLVLATLLFALFTATQLRIESEADSIWKFKRYSVVMEFASRPAVPPPFSIIHYLVSGVKYVVRGIRRKCGRGEEHRKMDPRVRGRRSFRHDDFHYWKGLVREYLRQREKTKREELAAHRTLDKLVQIHESLNFQTTGLRHLKQRMGDLEAIVGKLSASVAARPAAAAP
ncbi:putative Transient receptor potential cation channel subfamily M member 5 [Hypsibius exemplaris]|uniref:Transient receptor potential cation channel subfamily M member 5 n=1 Tax=Hypsibius exemplaris TaxID=2072580 RepID=A0A1W0WMF5_HYPEX|nr:putative Transient receptor potential cation channel subfamily M member 5 [Hypsibius exemplaris]